jgi:hypothetical protein
LNSGRVTEEIISLIALPNPFDKVITVVLELSSPALVNFKIFRLTSNEMIYAKQLEGNN